eukprot:scpid111515/ scgid7966/ 
MCASVTDDISILYLTLSLPADCSSDKALSTARLSAELCTPQCQALFTSSSKNRKANFSWIFWYFLYGISLSKVYIVGRQLIKEAIAVEKNRKIRSTSVLLAARSSASRCAKTYVITTMTMILLSQQ